MDAIDIMRKHLSPAFKGAGWDALLAGLAAGDKIVQDNNRAAFDQLFLSSASGKYLFERASDEGIAPPANVTMPEEVFRSFAIKTTSNKVIAQSLSDILQVFYGPDSTRGYAATTVAEPFALANGDTLSVLVDGRDAVTVTFSSTYFQNIAQATSNEVVASINRVFQQVGSKALAATYLDLTGKARVKIYSGAIGLSGSVAIQGGRAQNVLLFPTQQTVYTNGFAASTTWTVDVPSPGLARYTANKQIVKNIALWSETFDNAIWVKTFQPGTTVTANAIAGPTGTTTADRVDYDGSGSASGLRVYQSGPMSIVGEARTTSAWMRSVAGNVTVKLGNNVGSVVCNLTTAWQRYSVTTIGNGVSNHHVLTLNSDLSSNVAFSIYIWGAQQEISDTMGVYVPTTSAAASAASGESMPAGLIGVIPGDYVNVYGANFNAANRGSFVVTDVVVDYPGGLLSASFTVQNPVAVAQTNALQTAVSDLMAFRPMKGTVNNSSFPSYIAQAADSGYSVTLPVTTQIIGRALRSGAYAQSSAPLAITSVKRQGDSVYRSNLVRNSQKLAGAFWNTSTAAIVSSATTAPDGTLTADKLVDAVSGSVIHGSYQYVSFRNGVNYVASYYVKAAEFTTYTFGAFAGTAWTVNTGGYINFLTGAMPYGPLGTLASYGSVSVGGGWYRVWFSGKAQADASGQLFIELVDNTGLRVFTGTAGTQGNYIWGVQVEEGTVPSAYIPTTNTGTSVLTSTSGGGGSIVVTTSTPHGIPSDGLPHRVVLDGIVASRSLPAIYNGDHGATLRISNVCPVAFWDNLSDVDATAGLMYSTATTLADGQTVFVHGGFTNATTGSDFASRQPSVESRTIQIVPGPVVDGNKQYTFAITATTAPSTTRYGHTANLLTIGAGNGCVLISGGVTDTAGTMSTLCATRAPTGAWVPFATMSVARAFHSAITLSDGRVLLAGGMTNTTTCTATSDLLNASGLAASGAMSIARSEASAVALPGAKALITGGRSTPAGNPVATCEIWNAGTWTATGSMATPRYGHQTVVLNDGRVMALGGRGPTGQSVPSCEIYNPTTGTWAPAAPMSVKRLHFGALLLPNGTVFAAGGGLGNGEIYDPSTGVWSQIPQTPLHPTRYGAAYALASGIPVVVGGGDLPYDLGTRTAWHHVEIMVPGAMSASYGKLNGEYTVTGVVDANTFTCASDIANYVSGTGGTVTKVSAPAATGVGPYVWDTKKGFGVTAMETTIDPSITIGKGTSVPFLTVASTTNFPSTGWILIGFGTKYEVGPIPYYGVIDSTHLKVDASFVFSKTIPSKTTVTLLNQKGSFTPARPQSAGSFYVTASNAGLKAVSTILSDISASGVDILKNLVYPSDRGLGGEGQPVRGPKVSDKVAVWGGDATDVDMKAARNG